MYKKIFKRVFDFIISAISLIILSPLLAVVFVLLLIQNKGSVFFLQERPGLKERAFRIIKFKTMTDGRDAEGNLLPDNERMTVLGKLVRKLSIDELPQLINVMRGDMSLVGPRPLLFRYLPLYDETQRKRHNVRPGITGWAQVNGRNAISWSQKFAYDVYYVEHLSLGLDIKILFLTILKVVKKEGVDQSAMRPMQPFTGNN